MVLVKITDTAWLEGVQSEQHEAVKAQLLEAQQQAEQLRGELAGLQAEHEAACSTKAEAVQAKASLEKRVGPCRPAARLCHAGASMQLAAGSWSFGFTGSCHQHYPSRTRLVPGRVCSQAANPPGVIATCCMPVNWGAN